VVFRVLAASMRNGPSVRPCVRMFAFAQMYIALSLQRET
jgi:hypothetical protein